MASSWPISPPTLNASRLVTKPFVEISYLMILIERPKPWKKPKTSVAALVLGWKPNQRLVDDGQPDDSIDQVAVDADVEVHPEQHRRGVPQGEEADVDGDVLHPVEEEDHP